MSVRWSKHDMSLLPPGADAAEEGERLRRHRDFAIRMLTDLEPMYALRVWTTDTLSLVDALPEDWLEDDERHAAEYDRLRLMVRALYGLVHSGRLEPTRR